VIRVLREEERSVSLRSMSLKKRRTSSRIFEELQVSYLLENRKSDCYVFG
jgi:hypothetical protein